MVSNGEIAFYVDNLIIETLLSDEGLSKNAQASGMVASLISRVKDYVGNHIDPDDKSGSVLKILAPGAISYLFSTIGLGWLGVLIGLAINVFDIDVTSIWSSIYNEIKSLLSGDKQVRSSQVDSIVNSAIQQHNTSYNDDTMVNFQTKSEYKNLFKEAKLLKLTMIAYDQNLNSINKQSDNLVSFAAMRRSVFIRILSKVLSWIFKVTLASAGLMVAGDAVNKFLNRPNAFDDTIQHGKPTVPVEQVQAPPATVSHQNKFPLNPNYHDTQYNTNGNWIEKFQNSKSGIENMLISFVKDVYTGLDNMENTIKSTPTFQATVDEIAWYNHTAAGDPIVFIPKFFTSKKQLVDHFIDDIANRVSEPPTNTNKPSQETGERPSVFV